MTADLTWQSTNTVFQDFLNFDFILYFIWIKYMNIIILNITVRAELKVSWVSPGLRSGELYIVELLPIHSHTLL